MANRSHFKARKMWLEMRWGTFFAVTMTFNCFFVSGVKKALVSAPSSSVKLSSIFWRYMTDKLPVCQAVLPGLEWMITATKLIRLKFNPNLDLYVLYSKGSFFYSPWKILKGFLSDGKRPAGGDSGFKTGFTGFFLPLHTAYHCFHISPLEGSLPVEAWTRQQII